MTEEKNPFEIKPYATTELSPCPFCGHNEVVVSNEDFGWGQFKIRRQAWWIQCRSQHCYALQQGSTMEKAINRWNRRTN